MDRSSSVLGAAPGRGGPSVNEASTPDREPEDYERRSAPGATSDASGDHVEPDRG